MAKKSLRDAISKQIYYELFPPTLSKSDRRRKEIIEGAIEAYASIDYNHISFDDIATPANTSRRLVQHYFPDKDELFAVAMKVIRAQYQALVVDAFSQMPTAKDQFCEYIRAAVSWPIHEPVHVRAWFLYYLVCAQQPKLRRLHEDLAKMGEQRIAALVAAMYPHKKISPSSLRFVAKTVQRLIGGALLEICSESTAPNVDRIQDEIVQAALSIVNSVT